MAGVETANEPAQHDMERTDSMSSIDKEIDLLMRDGETEDTATDSQVKPPSHKTLFRYVLEKCSQTGLSRKTCW